ncbi:MAG: double zinc ribbon domain-containing protein [Spirochaetota bacterium]
MKTKQSHCYLCLAASSQFLCLNCRQQIAWVEQPSCRRCGIEAFQTDSQNSEEYCDSCRDIIKLSGFEKFCITRNYPLAYYHGLFAELLQWYKFSKELALGKYFSSLLQQVYLARFSGYFVVPVPPRESKLKQEAWDQVGYLCRKPLPVLRLLQRKAGIQQKYLNRKGRLEQLRAQPGYYLNLDARRLAWKHYRKQGPLHLLLLYDVYTTGTTMDMCRRALRPLEREGWIAEIRSLSLCLVI